MAEELSLNEKKNQSVSSFDIVNFFQSWLFFKIFVKKPVIPFVSSTPIKNSIGIFVIIS
jgi:hypothetical protein